MNEIALSILVPSVHTRHDNFAFALVSELFKQHRLLTPAQQAEVEIIVLTDTKSVPIGRKRNTMLEMAQGEYVAFVDDDDRVTGDYIQTLLKATESQADCITFDVWVSLNGGGEKVCHYGTKFRRDFNTDNAYYRLPNHLMCVKRDLALQARFPEIQRGEDSEYAKRLLPLIRTEHDVEKALYNYDYSDLTTETQK